MKKNDTLYVFQCIACILVVLIHVPFPGTFGLFFSETGRISVPLFFMVSGYFLYDSVGTEQYRKKLVARLKKNTALLVVFVVFYLLVDMSKIVLRHEGMEAVQRYVARWTATPVLLDFFLLDHFPVHFGGMILWFLLALLYIYIFNILIGGHLKKSHVKRLGVCGYCVLVLANVAIIVFTVLGDSFCGGFFASHGLYSNWLVSGLSCLYTGMACKQYIDEHREKLRAKPMWIALSVLLVVNFIFCYFLDRDLGLYLSYNGFTLLMDLLIFGISAVVETRSDNTFAILGQKYSRYVYILHPFVFMLTNVVFAGPLRGNIVGAHVQPVFVVIGSFFVSMVADRFVQKTFLRKYI